MGKRITTSFISTVLNGITVKKLPCASTNYNTCSARTVNYIAMHYTGNASDTAKNNAEYFAKTKVEASSHFFVDENEIYQSVALKDKAWHVGSKTYYNDCRNTNSFGIEMCCSGNYVVSDKTKENAAYLCAYLCDLIGVTAETVDQFVVRHYDVTHKECPRQMAGENNSEWNAFKEMVKSILKKVPFKEPITPVQPITNNNFSVKVTITNLNIRKGPGTNYSTNGVCPVGTYTIVETASGAGSKTGWGKLKSGAGWISLDYAKRI